MKKIALLFPGQGSQYLGMGKNLCENFPIAKEVFEEANNALGFDLMKLCFEGDITELTKTENTQPAILTASVAAFRVYMQEFGVKPLLTAGHSLGEISALACAGAIDFTDAVKIVRQRGVLMQQASALGTGAMAAVNGISKDVIEEECSKFSSVQNTVVVSNYNSPEQIVISGHKSAVFEMSEKLTQMGGRVIPLKVSAPFHSPLMQSAADSLVLELDKYTYSELKWTVVSNISALPYEGSNMIKDILKKQITSPVRWQESMKYMQSQGIEFVIEIGPQTVLKNLMKKNAPSITSYSYDKDEDIAEIKKELNVNTESRKVKQEFNHTVVTKCIQITVCTRNGNWDNDAYIKGVVEPYRKIQKIQEEIEKDGRQPTLEEMKMALDMLKTVFATKLVPIEEQIERFNEVFDVTGTKNLFQNFEMPSK